MQVNDSEVNDSEVNDSEVNDSEVNIISIIISIISIDQAYDSSTRNAQKALRDAEEAAIKKVNT